MRIIAMTGAVLSGLLVMLFSFEPISEAISVQQVILIGAMMICMFTCLSHIEK